MRATRSQQTHRDTAAMNLVVASALVAGPFLDRHGLHAMLVGMVVALLLLAIVHAWKAASF